MQSYTILLPVRTKRSGKLVYKMHRWRKAGNNVLSSIFKFKCINYTNTDQTNTEMNQGREGKVIQTLISSYQHEPYPSCNRGPIWQNSGEHMVKSMGWGPSAQFWNPIVPFTTRVLDTGVFTSLGPSFLLYEIRVHIISTYMMDYIWWLKVNVHQLLLICTIYYQRYIFPVLMNSHPFRSFSRKYVRE